MQVLMKYGGEKLDRDILGQLRSLGHLVSDINDECDSKDIACRRQVSKVALPQVMSAAQAVLQAISKDPHTARLKEVKELQDLFIEIEARLADSKGKEEGKYDSMRDKLEETMESLSRKVSSLRLQ